MTGLTASFVALLEVTLSMISLRLLKVTNMFLVAELFEEESLISFAWADKKIFVLFQRLRTVIGCEMLFCV